MKPTALPHLFIFRDSEGMPEPTPEQITALLRWMQSLKSKGQLLEQSPLGPAGKVVRASGVTDGPFAESKEVVGGYMLVAAADLAAAVRIARGCPILAAGTSLEVRPVSPWTE